MLNFKSLCDLHLGAVREVTSWNLMLLLDLGEDCRELVDKIVPLVFFTKKCWHFLLQITDNMCVSLEKEQIRH